MEARRKCGPVDRAAAYAFAAVIRAEGQRIFATGDAQVVPVKLVRTFFIAYPVFFGIPERSCFEANDAKTGASEALHQHASGRTNADNAVVDSLVVAEFSHWSRQRLHGAEAMNFALHQWLPP